MILREQCVLFGQGAEPSHDNDHRARRISNNYDIVPVQVERDIDS